MTEDLIDDWQCDVKGWLLLNSFAGGEHGRCVQLTTPSPDGYVQMTYNQARKFFRKAIREINKIEARYNAESPWWEEIKKLQDSLRPTNPKEEKEN